MRLPAVLAAAAVLVILAVVSAMLYGPHGSGIPQPRPGTAAVGR